MIGPTRCVTVIMVYGVMLLSISMLLLTIIASPTLVGAQIQSPSNANSTNSHKMGVKIISPSANTTVPSGQLTIHGISSDTPKTNCTVFVDWNDLKPMQNVTAIGPNGVNDYSNWTFVYTEKYHTIAPGIYELTSKITCFDNISNITSKYYSVNLTGSKNSTVSPTLPSSGNTTLRFQNVAHLPSFWLPLGYPSTK